MSSFHHQEAPLRSSSSPPNSTGSTADSDGWETPRHDRDCDRDLPSASDPPRPKKCKSFGGFKGPEKRVGDRPAPLKHPKSAGLLLDGRQKTEKAKKKKKLRRREEAERRTAAAAAAALNARSDASPPFLGRPIKEEPEDDFSTSTPYARAPDPGRSVATSGDFGVSPVGRFPADAPGFAVRCKEEPDAEPPCGGPPGTCGGAECRAGVPQDGDGEEEEAVVKTEGGPGKRIVIRQGKQVVFRDEDGSGDDEDIMVDSGMNDDPLARGTR